MIYLMSSGVSQANIALSRDAVVSSDAISYQQSAFSHPDYIFSQLPAQTGGQPINLGAGNPTTVINLPATEAFNLYMSDLNYQVVIPAPTTNTNYIWTFQDTVAEMQGIQYYGPTVGVGLMVDLDYLNNYFAVVGKKETSRNDFLTMGALGRLYPNNCLANVVPALRNSLTGATNPASKNYVEPAYFNVGAVGAAVTYNVIFPLRLIKNTLFSVNKTIYPGQLTYIKIKWAVMNKFCYMSANGTNPSGGVPTAFVGAQIQVQNLLLNLAVETNPNLKDQAMKASEAGFSMIIPFTTLYNTAGQPNTTQTIAYTFDVGAGQRIQKILHVPFNPIEQYDTAYDHSNSANNSTNVQKIASYQTKLNSRLEQEIILDCTTPVYTDYMYHRRMLSGSVIDGLDMYQHNWFHCSDYCNFGPEYDQSSNSALIAGIPMNQKGITWSFMGKAPANANIALQHYTWVTYTKTLTIKGNQIIVE